MSKPVKALATAELARHYTGTDSACVVGLSGLNVQEQQRLRCILRAKSGRLRVVKNSLARRAFEGGPLGPLGRALDGPCAIVTTSNSIIETAKVLIEAAKEFPKLQLKQAIMDGGRSLLTIEELARMRSRQEVVGDVAALILSPGRALAGCLRSPQAKIAGCLKAMIDKAA